MTEQRDVTRVREAVRRAGQRWATIRDDRDLLAAVVEACGFDKLGPDSSYDDLADAIALLLRAAGKDEAGTR